MERTQNYRALLLDVDGTLLCPQRKVLDQETVAALERVRRCGVRVVIATGRTLAAVRPEILGGFVPDYYICINGSYVAGRDGAVLYHRPMTLSQFEGTLALADREGCPLGFAFPEGYYMYHKDEVYRPYYQQVNGDMVTLRNGTDRTRHLEGLPCAAFGVISPEKMGSFRNPALGLHITAYDEDVYDICQPGITKATGAARLLEVTDLCWEELVAVGDGENDLELLRAAGLGVAMGNAPDHVKAAADAVTHTVTDFGVLKVIEDYFSDKIIG